MLNTVC